jgi:signal transduction histidine kinase
MMHCEGSQWTNVPLRRDGRFSTYFHTLSHDLRTPLTAITGFAEMLSLDTTLAVRQRECATAIVTACSELRDAVLLHLRLIENSLGSEESQRQMCDTASCADQPGQPPEDRSGCQVLSPNFAIGLPHAAAR